MILADKYEKSRIQFDIQSDIWQLGFTGSRSEWRGVVIVRVNSDVNVMSHETPGLVFFNPTAFVGCIDFKCSGLNNLWIQFSGLSSPHQTPDS